MPEPRRFGEVRAGARPAPGRNPRARRPPVERIRDHARTLPNFLGIQYRRLPEGGFAHISVIVAFDRAGSMIARAESGDADFTPVVEAIERASRGTQ